MRVSRVLAALGASLLASSTMLATPQTCQPGCAAGINYTSANPNILFVATCGGGTANTAADFGLQLSFVTTDGDCHDIGGGVCGDACSFDITVSYLMSQLCAGVTSLTLSGSECGTAITPITGLGYAGGFVTVYQKTLTFDCGDPSCTVRYVLTDPIQMPTENVGVAAILTCAACP